VVVRFGSVGPQAALGKGFQGRPSSAGGHGRRARR
jgi:hypothetical protein